MHNRIDGVIPTPVPAGSPYRDQTLRQLHLTDLRRVVTVAPQDPLCLEGTIRHNITLFPEEVSDIKFTPCLPGDCC